MKKEEGSFGRNNDCGVVSVVLGIISLVIPSIFGVVFGIVGLVFAMVQNKKSKNRCFYETLGRTKGNNKYFTQIRTHRC
jgi:uncharacterized membrane protein YbaN (DUF454 family)